MERNPFRYGAPVTGAWFCDRGDELSSLVQLMADGLHAFVLSPRRYGKTSLLLEAIAKLRARRGRAAYVNLLLCTTELEVAEAVLRGALEAALSGPERARHRLGDLLGRLRVQPHVSFAPDGSVVLGLQPGLAAAHWQTVLEDAVRLLAEASPRRPSALILDEFQVVATIGRRGLGASFKAAADAARATSLVFSGSHLSVMEGLTRGRTAPLEGMGERFVLGAIPAEAMVTYLRRRARSGHKRMERPTAVMIYERAGGVPNYVQWLAYASFQAAADDQVIEVTHVEAGLEREVDRQGGDFAERFEGLAPAQQRVLRRLASSPTSHPYTKEFLDAVAVANANAVTTALRVLSGRELLDRRQGGWQVANPFFRRWLERGPVGPTR